MHIALKRVSNAFLVALLLAANLLNIVPVSAQEPTPGSGLRISPTRTELVLDKGESAEVKQTVKNVTKSPVTVQPALNDFESDGVSGEPKLIGDPNEKSVYSLREFIRLPETFDLQPDEEREVIVPVNAPENASPGGYFGSVIYRASPVGSSGGGQVSLVASVGSLILVEIPGDITERIAVQNISAYLGENAGSFFTKKPDGIGLTIENQGNSFSKPFGKVEVKDFRGNVVFDYDMNGDSIKANILPSSTRLFLEELFNVEKKTVNGEDKSEKISPLKMPGRYTVTGNISHGTTGEVYTVSTAFWYIPLWMIVVLLLLVVVLVGGGIFVFRKFSTRSTKR